MVTSNNIPPAVAAMMAPVHPDSESSRYETMTAQPKTRKKEKEARAIAEGLAQMERAKPTEDQNPGL